jgi:hypothetical protein
MPVSRNWPSDGSTVSRYALIKAARYKVIRADLQGRESKAERVLVENLGHADALAIKNRLNAERHSDGYNWYVVIPQGREIWHGMEEFVDPEDPMDKADEADKVGIIWCVAQTPAEAATHKFCDGPSPRWRELLVGMGEGFVLVGLDTAGIRRLAFERRGGKMYLLPEPDQDTTQPF